MNCRKFAKLLPEIAAGEIDERTARMADAHAERCPACAAELVSQKEALAALAMPREARDVPESLAVLTIPEHCVRRNTARRAVAFGAVAACIALEVLSVIKLQQRPQSQTKPAQIIVKPAPPRIQEPVQQLPSIDRTVAQSAKPSIPVKRQMASKPNPVQKRQKRPTRPRIIKSAPTPKPELEIPPPVQPEEEWVIVQDTKPVIVVATRIEPPATIEVTSVDNVTGEWTHYYAVYDYENQQSVEVLHTSIEEGREP